MVDHVHMREDNKLYASNRFSISESGMIGVSCDEKPSLSVMYPGTDKPPIILSDDKIYRSATFLKTRGKEYLATACDEDGRRYLWDTSLKRPRKSLTRSCPVNKLTKK